MRFHRFVAVLVLVVPGNAALAQFAGALGVGSGVGQIGSAGWARESRLEPSFRLEYPLASLRFDGMAAERSGVLSVDHASMSGVLATPGFGPFRFSTEVQYGRSAWTTTAPTAALAPSLSISHGPIGAWLGTAHARHDRSRLQAGIWTSLRSTVLTLYGSTRSESMLSIGTRTVRDSIANDTTGGWHHFDRTLADTSSRYSLFGASQLNARLDWSRGRMALNALLSTSRPFRDRRDSSATGAGGALVWGSVNASFMLNNRLALIAGVGTQPGTSKHPGGSRFASFGLRLSPAALLREPLPAPVRPAASSFAVERIEAGLYRFVLRVPGARTVELSGDFNQWTPTSMTQSAPEVWEVTMPLHAGTHRVNVRVNGDRWSAPPGLPTVRDEFNGTVGILLVR